MNNSQQNLYFEIISFFYILKHTNMISNFRKDFFSEPTIRNVFDYAKDFINEYKVEPTSEQLIEIISIHDKSEQIPPESIRMLWKNHDNIGKYSDDWLLTNISAWGQWMSFYTGLQNVISYVQTLPSNMEFTMCGNYIDKAKTIFASGASFTMNTSDGHDFFDPVNHQLTLLDTRSTGYKFVDQCLNGGFANKTLNVFMGSPKVGKSMWLCNLAANSVKAGHNTIYITLEMSYQKVSQRIGANLFNIKMDEYKKASDDPNFLQQKMKEFYQSSIIEPGKFIIEEFPTSTLNADDLESFLLKLEEKYSTENRPFKFKNVFIDYINIMEDKKNPNSDNTYLKIKNICESLRAVMQRNDWCGVSLTQTNRQGYDASDMSMSTVSESGGLIATVDSLFGIIQTPLMRAEGVYYLKGIALRDSPHMGDRKRFKFNGSYLRIEEDLTEEIIPEGMDIPSHYQAATTDTMFGNKQQYSQQHPKQQVQQVQSSPAETPQLGLSEQQITGINLFNMN